jgi:hypothetical protein
MRCANVNFNVEPVSPGNAQLYANPTPFMKITPLLFVLLPLISIAAGCASSPTVKGEQHPSIREAKASRNHVSERKTKHTRESEGEEDMSFLERPNRSDPLVETPLGTMRKSEWDAARQHELERRAQPR